LTPERNDEGNGDLFLGVATRKLMAVQSPAVVAVGLAGPKWLVMKLQTLGTQVCLKKLRAKSPTRQGNVPVQKGDCGKSARWSNVQARTMQSCREQLPYARPRA